MAGGTDLVTFNVGGKIYTVLREPTLSLHPNSLLTQLAEDRQQENEIFVEGDQDLFKYVLEYHRDRKIILPAVVSKEAVLRELKRFGLDVEPEEIVEDGVPLSNIRKRMDAEAGRLLQAQKKHTTDLLVSLTAQLVLEKGRVGGTGAISVASAELLQKHSLPGWFGFNFAYDQKQLEESLGSWSSSAGFVAKFAYPSTGQWTVTLSPAV